MNDSSGDQEWITERVYLSGGREVSLEGSKLEFVEAVKHSGSSEQPRPHVRNGTLVYSSPAGVLDSTGSRQVSVELLVGNSSVTCREELTYLPDPQFTSFTTTRMGKNIRVVIQKSADALQLKGSEVDVQVRRGAESYRCVMDRIEHSADLDSVICEVRGVKDISVEVDALTVRVGGFSVVFQTSDSQLYRNVLITLAAVLCTLVMTYCCHRRKTRSAAERVELGAVEQADRAVGLPLMHDLSVGTSSPYVPYVNQ
ncbi:plexin-D1-like [Sardina pilchardus]|uniref:plexin-D1-like n=1 Tax=Sardina pilchardus TaxID=27697 RepID=UPI002E11C85E